MEKSKEEIANQELLMRNAIKRSRDYRKIIEDIKSEFELEFVGTNHVILHEKDIGRRIELDGLSAIFRWCVEYVTNNYLEEKIPMVKLHYMPMALVQVAVASEVNNESR